MVEINNDIKNNYVLKKIFDNLIISKCLNIIWYNKKIQKRLNKNKDNFKNEYSKIEIELIPNQYSLITFINTYNNISHFHIYINDNNEEIKRNYITSYDKAKKIRIIIDCEIKSFNKLFKECENIKRIYFRSFNRRDIDDMSYMFYKCTSLEELDISKMKTDDVKNMEYMFYECSSLKKLIISNFKTDNVKSMSNMFKRCFLLENLDLSNFNTKNVIDMREMFDSCRSLQKINVSNFDTENVIHMNHMFNECSSLKELDLSNFHTDNAIDMNYMFNECSSIIKLNFPIVHHWKKLIFQSLELVELQKWIVCSKDVIN